MPELPEVETVRRGLEPAMLAARFVRVEQRRPNLRLPFPEHFAERLVGRSIVALSRRAKYLLVELDNDDILVMHLGMSGSFRIEGDLSSISPGVFHHDRSKAAAHDHVVFFLSNGVQIIYNDPRRFGFMLLESRAALAHHPYFAEIGLEPLGNELNGEMLLKLFEGVTAPLKAALLNQKKIAGLGNIYVCEALNRAQLSPERLAGTLKDLPGKADALALIIREVLLEAVEAGGSSLKDHRQTDGSLGYFQHSFRAYDRVGVPCCNAGCTGKIEKMTQGGRSTFFCATCQI